MEEKPDLQQAAETARRSVDRAAGESIKAIQERNRKRNMERYGCDCPAAKCYTSCPRVLANAGSEDLFRWWAKTSPPDNRAREAVLSIPGPPEKKGGSGRKGRRRSHKKPLAAERFRLF